MTDRTTEPGDAARHAAYRNIEAAIDRARGLPAQVFRPEWTVFRVFDADGLLHPEFVHVAASLLEVEGATCLCVADLETPAALRVSEALHIDRTTTEAAYCTAYGRLDPRNGWDVRFTTLGVASNVGRLCIYCEQKEEYALIAFRDRASFETLRPALAWLEAVPIREAIERPTIFTFEHMLPAFRDAMLRNYSGA